MNPERSARSGAQGRSRRQRQRLAIRSSGARPAARRRRRSSRLASTAMCRGLAPGRRLLADGPVEPGALRRPDLPPLTSGAGSTGRDEAFSSPPALAGDHLVAGALSSTAAISWPAPERRLGRSAGLVPLAPGWGPGPAGPARSVTPFLGRGGPGQSRPGAPGAFGRTLRPSSAALRAGRLPAARGPWPCPPPPPWPDA